VALAWVFKWELPYDVVAEPITVWLSLITVPVTGMVAYFGVELGAKFIRRFREEFEKLPADMPDAAEHVKLTDNRLEFLDTAPAGTAAEA
jgi:hypothetical protein